MKEFETTWLYLCRLCADCEVICLGAYTGYVNNYHVNVDRVEVRHWFSGYHNMGMALNRHTWTRIRNCSEVRGARNKKIR